MDSKLHMLLIRVMCTRPGTMKVCLVQQTGVGRGKKGLHGNPNTTIGQAQTKYCSCKVVLCKCYKASLKFKQHFVIGGVLLLEYRNPTSLYAWICSFSGNLNSCLCTTYIYPKNTQFAIISTKSDPFVALSAQFGLNHVTNTKAQTLHLESIALIKSPFHSAYFPHVRYFLIHAASFPLFGTEENRYLPLLGWLCKHVVNHVICIMYKC